MVKKIAAIGLLVLAVGMAAITSAALRPSAAPSGPIQAVPLQPNNAGTLQSNNNETPEGSAPAGSTTTVFRIQPGASSARFMIDEILRGSPQTVVGTSDQVSGEIAVDLAAPSTAQIGTILVGARSFVTDEPQRNRVIANLILVTDQFEYVSFKPTSIEGLPTIASQGAGHPMQIIGDLTIRDITRPVTFTASVTPVSTTEMRASASTTIRYADWGIAIPQVPAVAGVGDTVSLQLDFVATAT